MSDGEIPFLVEDGYDTGIYLGVANMHALIYPDGSIGFEHLCDRGERGVVICAPKLQLDSGGHRVESMSPLTITPSVSCPDCGIHGYITDGTWVPF